MPPSKTILLVEDHELNVKLIKDVLEYQGYTIVVSGLGASTLDLAREHRPDLILLDIQLPDIPGTEAARQLKADDQTCAIPVIAVTAFAMKGDDAEFLASGFDAHIAKPFNVREFVQTIDNMVTK